MHSVFKMDKKYYLQLSFKEWKYVVKENEMAELINDQLEVSSDHSDEEVSHEEKIKNIYPGSAFDHCWLNGW